MGVFNWDANEVGHVGSQHLWLYFAISVPLIFLVLLVWVVWDKLRQKMYEEKGDIESGKKC